MREIQFRAWDENIKVYAPFDCILGFILSVNDDRLTIDGNKYEDTYILEQYTGLKDKNGEEIYEGDIVKEIYEKHFVKIGGVVKQINPPEEMIKFAKVVYGGGQFFFSNSYGCYEPVGYKPQEWEIIGNIHENPELFNG